MIVLADFDRESMLETFTFEMNQLLTQLEQLVIESESGFTMDKINEIFRIMHTIKGSAAMMLYENISKCAHSIEDLFYFLRENQPGNLDNSAIADLVLEGGDFIKNEISKLEGGQTPDGDPTDIIARIGVYVTMLKGGGGETEEVTAAPSQDVATASAKAKKSGNHAYRVTVMFAPGAEMENVRAFAMVKNLKPASDNIIHEPRNLMDESCVDQIRNQGFTLRFSSKMSVDELHSLFENMLYIQSVDIEEEENAYTEEARTYNVIIRFEDGAEMENVRAFTAVHNLTDQVDSVKTIPEDLLDELSADVIRRNGFKMTIVTSKGYDDVVGLLDNTLFLKELTVEDVTPATPQPAPKPASPAKTATSAPKAGATSAPAASSAPAATTPAQNAPATQHTQQMISVNVSKLDTLLKLMGELVIAEAMVTQNPELVNLQLESFTKEATQLRKIISDLQETVMGMRMVPLSTTFFRMHRIVRDMCKQLEKEVNLEIVGAETEVDKNIIEHISDPIMHIIRNSVDHGIEKPAERLAAGKKEAGTVILEAKNSGSDVLIIITDDGAGLDHERILKKAKNQGLLKKPENEYTEREINQFIMMPGFSTNEVVTSFSGRGVGMDVVTKNIEAVGGSVLVDSTPGQGTVFTLKIPLTLAIVKGMTITMGGSKYTLPIASIRDSFKPQMKDVFTDPDGNEMITVRNECYNIVRLYEFFNVNTAITNLEEGIMMMIENGDDTVCLFVDDIVGEQQVVVKSMPKYFPRIKGVSGCTLLGNGDISLIIDTVGFFDK